MPSFYRDNDRFGGQRRPKPRPNSTGGGSGNTSGNFAPRYESGPPRNRPPQPPPKPRRSAGPARIEPRKPVSGKDRRRMMKAAAWRLAQLMHVRPSDVIKTVLENPRPEQLLAVQTVRENRGEAFRLVAKIRRLVKR